jgi:hypothetical protein
MEPATLFQRAKKNWHPEHEPIALPLEEAVQLSSPGTYIAPAPDVRAEVPPLKLSAMPAKFDGPGERLSLVRSRTTTMLPLIAASQKEAAKRLQKLALDELNLQRATIDKYLVESRFALARIYDGELPESDQDEFELDDQGKPIRQEKLQRGEFEVDKSKPLDPQLQRGRPKPPATRRGADDEVEVK